MSNFILEDDTQQRNADPSALLIDQHAKEATLNEKLTDNRVRCNACGHRCVIKDGGRGYCQVRFNRGGNLFAPHGYVSGIQNDPTEKKPFYHVYPGSHTLTFGMLGCNMRCSYCQNWDISQAIRDSEAGRSVLPISSDEIITLARRHHSTCIASSYNEPLITSEWSVEIFEKAVKDGLATLYVSNGYATPEVLSFIRPVTHGFKVDLKTMNKAHYRELGAERDRVLESIALAYELGFWVELVTLLIPGYNDSTEEIGEMIRFIKGISPDIPWHVIGFQPMYRMLDKASTGADLLIRVAEHAYAEGLHYVYAGNRAGQVGNYENTYCPNCHATLIERYAYFISRYGITGEGTCPHCGHAIAGIWYDDPSQMKKRTPR